MSGSHSAGWRDVSFRSHLLDHLRDVHNSTNELASALKQDQEQAEVHGVQIAGSIWLAFITNIAKDVNKLLIKEGLPTLESYDQKSSDPIMMAQLRAEKAVWSKFPRGSPTYSVAMNNFKDAASFCPAAAIELVLNLTPGDSNAYKKMLSSADGVERPLTNTGDYGLDALLPEITNFNGNQRYWDLIECVFNILIADALSAILRCPDVQENLMNNIVADLIERAFQFQRTRSPMMLQAPLWKTMTSVLSQQWAVVLQLLSQANGDAIVDKMWKLLDTEPKPQTEDILAYVNAIRYLDYDVKTAEGASLARKVLDKLVNNLESKALTKHLKVLDSKAKKLITRVQVQAIDRILQQIVLNDEEAVEDPSLHTTMNSLFELATKWSKSDNLKSESFRIMSTILSRSSDKFHKDNLDGFLKKRVLKSVWTSSKRTHCLESIRRLLRGSYAKRTFGWIPTGWSVQAISGDSESHIYDPSPYTYFPRPSYNPYDVEQYIRSITSEIFQKKKPLPKLYRSIDLTVDILLQMTSQVPQYMQQALFPMLLTDLSTMEHVLIAMRTLRILLDPSFNCNSEMTKSKWNKENPSPLDALFNWLPKAASSDILRFALHCEKLVGWESVGKSTEPVPVTSRFQSFPHTPEVEIDEDDEDEDESAAQPSEEPTRAADPASTAADKDKKISRKKEAGLGVFGLGHGGPEKHKDLKPEQLLAINLYKECVLLLPFVPVKDLLERYSGSVREFFLGKLLVHRSPILSSAVSATLQKLMVTQPAWRPIIVEGLLSLLADDYYQDDASQMTLLLHLCSLCDLWSRISSGAVAGAVTKDSVLPSEAMLAKADALVLCVLARNNTLLRSVSLRFLESLRKLESAFYFEQISGPEESGKIISEEDFEMEVTGARMDDDYAANLVTSLARRLPARTSIRDSMRLADVIAIFGLDIAQSARYQHVLDQAGGLSTGPAIKGKLARAAPTLGQSAAKSEAQDPEGKPNLWSYQLAGLCKCYIEHCSPAAAKELHVAIEKQYGWLPTRPATLSEASSSEGKHVYTPEVIEFIRNTMAAFVATTGGPDYAIPQRPQEESFIDMQCRIAGVQTKSDAKKAHDLTLSSSLLLLQDEMREPVLQVFCEKSGKQVEALGKTDGVNKNDVAGMLQDLVYRLQAASFDIPSHLVRQMDKLSRWAERVMSDLMKKGTLVTISDWIDIVVRLLITQSCLPVQSIDTLVVMSDVSSLNTIIKKVWPEMFNGLMNDVGWVRETSSFALGCVHWRSMSATISSLVQFLKSVDLTNPKTEAIVRVQRDRARLLAIQCIRSMAMTSDFKILVTSDLRSGGEVINTLALFLSENLDIIQQGCACADPEPDRTSALPLEIPPQIVPWCVEHARLVGHIADAMLVPAVYSRKGRLRKALLPSKAVGVWTLPARVRIAKYLRAWTGIDVYTIALSENELKKMKKGDRESAVKDFETSLKQLTGASKWAAEKLCQVGPIVMSDETQAAPAAARPASGQPQEHAPELSKNLLSWLSRMEKDGYSVCKWHLSYFFPTVIHYACDDFFATLDACWYSAVFDQFERPSVSMPSMATFSEQQVFYGNMARETSLQLQLESLPLTSPGSLASEYGRLAASASWSDSSFSTQVHTNAGPLLHLALLNLTHPQKEMRTRAIAMLNRLAPDLAYPMATDVSSAWPEDALKFHNYLSSFTNSFGSDSASVYRHRASLLSKAVSEACKSHTLDLVTEALTQWKCYFNRTKKTLSEQEATSAINSVLDGATQGGKCTDLFWVFEVIQPWCLNVDMERDAKAKALLPTLYEITCLISTPFSFHAEIGALWQHLVLGSYSRLLDKAETSLTQLPNLRVALDWLLETISTGLNDLPVWSSILVYLYRYFPQATLTPLIADLSVSGRAAIYEPPDPTIDEQAQPNYHRVVATVLTISEFATENFRPLIRHLPVLLNFAFLHLNIVDENAVAGQVVPRFSKSSAAVTLMSQLLMGLKCELFTLEKDDVVDVAAALRSIDSISRCIKLPTFKLYYGDVTGRALGEASTMKSSVQPHRTGPITARTLNTWLSGSVHALSLFDHVISLFGLIMSGVGNQWEKELINWAVQCRNFDIAINAHVLLRHVVTLHNDALALSANQEKLAGPILSSLLTAMDCLNADWANVRSILIRLNLENADPFTMSNLMRDARNKLMKDLKLDQRHLVLSYALAAEIMSTLKILIIQAKAAQKLHMYPEYFWSAVAVLRSPMIAFPLLPHAAFEIVSTYLSNTHKPLFASFKAGATQSQYAFDVSSFKCLADRWNPPFDGLLPLFVQGMLNASTRRLALTTAPFLSTVLPPALVSPAEPFFFKTLALLLPWTLLMLTSLQNTRATDDGYGADPAMLTNVAKELVEVAKRSDVPVNPAVVDVLSKVADGSFVRKGGDEVFVIAMADALCEHHFPEHVGIFVHTFRVMLHTEDRTLFPYVLRIVASFLAHPKHTSYIMSLAEVVRVACLWAPLAAAAGPVCVLSAKYSLNRGDAMDLSATPPMYRREVPMLDHDHKVSYTCSSLRAIIATKNQSSALPSMVERRKIKFSGVSRSVLEDLMAFYKNNRLIFTVHPRAAPYSGGTEIAIDGAHLCMGGTDCKGVTLAGVQATVLEQTESRLLVKTGPGSGSGDVVIKSEQLGDVTLKNGFTYIRGEVTSVSPNSGPACGGNKIVIKGHNLGGPRGHVTSVEVKGVPVNSILYETEDEVAVLLGACMPGAGSIKIVSELSGETVVPNAYTYNPGGAALSASPNNGPAAGGNKVTLSAVNLGNGQDIVNVLLCGVQAQIVSQSPSQVVVQAGSNEGEPSGTGDIVVESTAYGKTTLSNGYTYNPLGDLHKVTPVDGPMSGGNVVELIGTDLCNGEDVSSVELDGVSVASILTQTKDKITVEAGPGMNCLGRGIVTIVSTSHGETVLTDGYRYNAPGHVTSVAPDNGPYAGQIEVCIKGKDLGNCSDIFGVTLCGVAATIVSQTADEVVVKAGTSDHSGAGEVVIKSTSRGTTSQADGYTINPHGRIIGLTPSQGPLSGGRNVLVSGTDLGLGSDIQTVLVGGKQAEIVRQSKHSLEFVLPAKSAEGPVDVAISSVGCGLTSLAGCFTYLVPGAVTSIKPMVGPCAGGQMVVISGRMLGSGADVTSVKLCGVDASILSQSEKEIIVNSGRNDAVATSGKDVKGVVEVLSESRGLAMVPPNICYSYSSPGSISGVSPNRGPCAGGNEVVISGLLGSGADISDVSLCGVKAEIVSQTKGSVTVKVGNGTEHQGEGDVVVVSESVGTTTLPLGYFYNPAGGKLIAKPSNGPLDGGNTITMEGGSEIGNGDITSVMLGTAKATIVSQTARAVTINVPNMAAVLGPQGGAVDVTVISTSFGKTVSEAAYRFNQKSEIMDVRPMSSPYCGGAVATITGNGLGSGSDITSVSICGKECLIKEQSRTKVDVVIPASGGFAGEGEVLVKSVSTGVATLRGFTYYPQGTVKSVSPSSGPLTGGNALTIKGSYMGSGSDIISVTLCGVESTITDQGPDYVTVLAGHGAGHVGPGMVVVTSSGYGTTKSSGNAYTYSNPGKVTKVAPTSGPYSGGNTIEILGENLCNGSDITSISVCGVPAVAVKQSATRIEAVLGDGRNHIGTGDIIVTSESHGMSVSSSTACQYTYEAMPTISKVSPPYGPHTGGYTVTISGQCFCSDKDGEVYEVTLNGVRAKIISASPNCVKVQAGDGSAHMTRGDVVVCSSSRGIARFANGFKYNTPDEQLAINRQMEAERRARASQRQYVVQFINDKLGHEEALKGVLPIDIHSNTAYLDAVKSGVLLVKLLLFASPLVVDDESLVTKNPTREQMDANLRLFFTGASKVGVDTGDLAPYDFLEGISPDTAKADVVASVLVELIRIYLFSGITVKKYSEFARLRVFHDIAGAADPKNMPPENLLLRWVNHHLQKARSNRRATNFGTDFADCEIYLTLAMAFNTKATMVPMLEPNLTKRAEATLALLETMGMRYFVRPIDIVEANSELNSWLVAYMFGKYPTMVLSGDESQVLDFCLDGKADKDERTIRLWVKSLGVLNVGNKIWPALMDGFSIFFLLDKISPGCVSWTQVNNPSKKALNQFKLQENWNKVIEIITTLRPRFPAGVSAGDLLQGYPDKFRTLLSEMMEYDLAENLVKTHPDESELLRWANQQVAEASKSTSITNFHDPELKTGLFLCDLLHAISPKSGTVNYMEVTRGATTAECERNAKVVIRSAWRYGIPTWLTVEDIMTVNTRRITAFVYQIHTTLHRYC